MSNSGIQLELVFEETANRFKDRLDNGSFFVLAEVNTPAKKSDLSAAVNRASEIEYAVSGVRNIPACLAITDKYLSPDSWNIGDFASQLCKSGRDNHLLYISGKNASLDELIETMEFCRSSGFKNFVPVSGDGVSGENMKQTGKRTFTEGIHLLRRMKSQDDSTLFGGCAFNPFKYTPCDHFTQYFKLIKKINQGANFFVTQFGWDMLKLQELRWYLSSRGLYQPSIARLLLLTPEWVEQISAGKCPGVHISPDFQGILRKEVNYSYKQFEAAQWRRLQIQAAGCKLLGYSGVQIAGLRNAEQVGIACNMIVEALNEFKTFESWKNEYYEHLARAEMAPYPYRFYMFDKLFSEAHVDDFPSMKEGKIPQCSSSEKLHYRICEFLFSHASRQEADEHLITKKLFAGCRKCSFCRLPLTHYICPELCPKGLSNGPCGGSQADGSCELGEMECIHSKRMRLASWLNEIDSLEEHYIKFAKKYSKAKK